MATKQLEIINWHARPDASEDVFFEPASVKMTTTPFDGQVLIFNNSGNRDGFVGQFKVPEEYVSTPKILVPWTSTATAGDIVLDLDYRAVAIGESMNQAAQETNVTVTDDAPLTTLFLLEAILTPTAGNFAAGDEVQYEVFRDSGDVSDDMGAAIICFGIYFEYSDA